MAIFQKDEILEERAAIKGANGDENERERSPEPSLAADEFLDLFLSASSSMVRSASVRRLAARGFRRMVKSDAAQKQAEGRGNPGIIRDRCDMALAIIDTVERALADDRLSDATVDRILNVFVKEVLIRRGDRATKEAFREDHGCYPPSFMVISPGQGCNLACTGCYAASDRTQTALPWPVFERLVEQVRDLWESRFVVLSGGEPLVYRDQGRGILDMAEAHQDMFFMFYTNGTLIDDACAKRIAELGNVMPAISVEGMREETDARRGEGVYDRIHQAMAALREHKAAYGLSMTATCHNADMLLSDEVIDHFFDDEGVLFSWLFHYMPIGRDASLALMPTTEQRRSLWQRSWRHIRQRGIFIADFWSGGTLVNGCISSGRAGGYFYVNWDGNMSPCVFVPYAPVNIRQLFSEGKTINDAWEHPFFADMRGWQREYGYCDGEMADQCRNWLTPCPIRDHHADFRAILSRHQDEAKAMDAAAAAALNDPGYYEGMTEFDRALSRVMDPIWEEHYQGRQTNRVVPAFERE